MRVYETSVYNGPLVGCFLVNVVCLYGIGAPRCTCSSLLPFDSAGPNRHINASRVEMMRDNDGQQPAFILSVCVCPAPDGGVFCFGVFVGVVVVGK